jgi:hypothetical protein
VLADLAEAEGRELIKWAESVRSNAISYYWEKQDEIGVNPERMVRRHPGA